MDNLWQLKAKHERGWYKNDKAWIDAIYRNNKDRIDAAYEPGNGIVYPGRKSEKALFRADIIKRAAVANVKGRKTDENVKAAIKRARQESAGQTKGRGRPKTRIAGLDKIVKQASQSTMYMSKSDRGKQDLIRIIHNKPHLWRVWTRKAGWQTSYADYDALRYIGNGVTEYTNPRTGAEWAVKVDYSPKSGVSYDVTIKDIATGEEYNG